MKARIALISLLFVSLHAYSQELLSTSTTQVEIDDCNYSESFAAPNHERTKSLVRLDKTALVLVDTDEGGPIVFIKSQCTEEDEFCAVFGDSENPAYAERSVALLCNSDVNNCVREENAEGRFSLRSSHDPFPVYNGDGSDKKNQTLFISKVFPLIQRCKAQYSAPPAPNRSYREELADQAKDDIREALQEQNLTFTEVNEYGENIFSAVLCGTVQTPEGKHSRFVSELGIDSLHLETTSTAEQFNKSWSLCCP